MKIKKITLMKIILLIAIVGTSLIVCMNYFQERTTISEGTQIAVEAKDKIEVIGIDGEKVVEITQTVDRRVGTTFYCTLNFQAEKCIKSIKNITTNETVTNDEKVEDWKNVSMAISGEKTKEYTFRITMASGQEVNTRFKIQELFPSNNHAPSKPVITVNSDATYFFERDNVTVTAESTDEDGDWIKYEWEGRTSITAKYELGEHTFRVRAIDIYGAESEWEEYTIHVIEGAKIGSLVRYKGITWKIVSYASTDEEGNAFYVCYPYTEQTKHYMTFTSKSTETLDTMKTRFLSEYRTAIQNEFGTETGNVKVKSISSASLNNWNDYPGGSIDPFFSGGIYISTGYSMRAWGYTSYSQYISTEVRI